MGRDFGRYLHRPRAGSGATHHWLDYPNGCGLLYSLCLFGPELPPPRTHRGYDVSRLVGHLFITLEGIFGVPIDVSATLIIMFTIYGAILQHSGAGKFFIDFSLAV